MVRRLPAFRHKVAADLAKSGLERERILAVALRMLDHGVFRTGGTQYADEYGSPGCRHLAPQRRLRPAGEAALEGPPDLACDGVRRRGPGRNGTAQQQTRDPAGHPGDARGGLRRARQHPGRDPPVVRRSARDLPVRTRSDDREGHSAGRVA
ncbi:hypothetical protein [Kribbella sp. NBC_01245]|uniref:hypothetical protein n=1 Tax=Kribbella sp. NBC_01245 TaxID=2903578 RepID=UPI002E2C65C6|nr:hypothetical protein [Kribbella sp. NBC_01245]